MGLTRKLLLAMMGTVILVTAAATYVHVMQLRDALLADTVEDELLFARSLRTLIADAWRVDGEAEARRLVADLRRDPITRDLQIDLADPGPEGVAESEGSRWSLREGERVFVKDARLFVRMPLGVPGAPAVELRLERGLETLDTILERSAWVSAAAGLMTIVTCAVLISVLGWFLVGKPIGALIGQTKRIAEGEVVAPPGDDTDEIGELANALALMSARLAEAREHIREQHEEKLEAQEQLRHADRLRTVGELAGGIAHEIGTPLNVVQGRARLIERAEGASEEIQADARIIVEQAQRIAQLVRQLLDYSRRSKNRREQTDLAAMVNRVAHLLGPIAAKRGVAIDANVARMPIWVEADPVLLEQAITNVAVNGIQAMNGRGQLTLKVRESSPDELGEDVEARYQISVIDDGPGIDEAIQDRVFDPFFTTKGVGEGTGLGLSVASGIVTDHAGSIEVSREPGRGARFDIAIPKTAPRDSAPPSGKRTRRSKQKRRQ